MSTPGSPPSPLGSRGERGFTLVECATACAITVLLAAVALPSLRSDALRAARSDGVSALGGLQLAQEQHRALHGLYAGELSALKGVAALSLQGRYVVTLELTGAEAYRASASARGMQVHDKDCPVLTVDVDQGRARFGPTTACWNR